MVERAEIESYLKEFARPYSDRRVNVFAVEIADFQPGMLVLRGRVLEAEQRQGLVEGLSSRFPGLHIDAGALEVARQTPPRLFSVATNLTSMHDGTSFLTEQVTQMLNGAVVELLWQEKNWIFARQTVDGYLGWTYLPYLTESPAPQLTHLVIEPVEPLREQPAADAGLLTRVLGGTAVCVAETRGGWSQVDLAGGWKGWLPAASLRPADQMPGAPEARRSQMAADAFRMIGVPYLWGGCSANGIDCSGFAQLLHRWIGITIPRDADMQYDAGDPVEPPFKPGDLVFFGEKGESRRITHVGISLGGWRIIHSSRSRNGVQVDDVQAVDHLRDSYLCAARYIER